MKYKWNTRTKKKISFNNFYQKQVEILWAYKSIKHRIEEVNCMKIGYFSLN